MYRHFAVITLCVTFCLAMFADGEHRDAMMEKAQARESQNRMMQAEKLKVGERKIGTKGVKFRDGRSAKGSFGPDRSPPEEYDVGYGFGSNRPEGSVTYGSFEPFSAAERETEGGSGTPVVLPPGLSEEEIIDLMLVRQGEKPKKRPTSSELERLLEASRRRSGVESDDED
jgi:hypothetical protein